MQQREEARHIVELMVYTAWADARVDVHEALTIHRLCANTPELRALGPTDALSEAARRRLLERGLDACVAEAAAGIVTPALRELAFQCCAKVSAADGRYVPEEARVLAALEQAWGLSRADIDRLLVLATR